MNGVEEVADGPAGFVPPGAIPTKHLVPLAEIIAAALGCGTETAAVKKEYDRLISIAGTEFNILLRMEEKDLARFTPPKILNGILNVRQGKVEVSPGYDGVYGKVSITTEKASPGKGEKAQQMSLF